MPVSIGPGGVRVSLVAAIMLSMVAPAKSGDGERTRYYLNLRFAESNPLSDAHDAAGGSIGVNVGSHLGFELSVGSYELFLEIPGPWSRPRRTSQARHAGRGGCRRRPKPWRMRRPVERGRLGGRAETAIGR